MNEDETKMIVIAVMAAVMFVGRYIKNGAAQANHAIGAAKDFFETLEADGRGEP